MQKSKEERKKNYVFLMRLPHKFFLDLKRLLREREKDLSWLLEREFPEQFYMAYPDASDEIHWIYFIHEKGILQEFYEKSNAAMWEKRVFIQKTLCVLLNDFKEFEAVEVIESLMGVFHWDIEMEIYRNWDVKEEDKADFHREISGIRDIHWNSY